jgi:uroporphyrinogen decarboxylase
LAAIGAEAVIVFNDILIPLEHAGARVEFDEQGPLIRNPIQDGAALAALEAAGAPRAVAGDEPVALAIRRVRERVGDDVPILGFAGAPWTLAAYWVEGRMSRGLERVGALRFADPPLLEALMERIVGVVIDYLKIQIAAGADAVQIFDTWGGILGQAEYARFSAPWLRRVVQAIRPLGTPVIVYVNGCGPLLDQLATLGADCVSVDWRMDLARARAALGPGVAIQGNLDPLALVAGPEAATRAVAQLFEAFPPGPGHVFNLGHGILPKTPPAAARAAMDEVKRRGRYA